MGSPADEPVEVVDRGGRVTAVVSRAEMRAGNLRHRCTYVAVVAGDPPPDVSDPAALGLTADSELWVHRRADWKDTNPSFWDVAFGGVCGVGEPWAVSAGRELAEEAGILDVPLVELGPCHYEDAVTRVVGMVYLTWWREEPSCQDGEVVAVDRVALGRLARWSKDRDVCPDSVSVVLPLLLGS